MGAIDGCHMEINAPTDNHEDYFNRKQHYSVYLQAIVDSNLKFIHVTVGYPGSINDPRVLRLSGLYELEENEQILSGPTRNINGTEIRPLLAGDSAYPLTNWLVKPYPGRGRLTPEQRNFNVKFSALRSECSGTSIWHVESSLENCVEKGWTKTEHPKKDCDCCLRFAQHLY